MDTVGRGFRTCVKWGEEGRLHLAVFVLLFTTGKSTDGDTGGVALHHLFAALAAHLEVEAALDDAEEVLTLGVAGAGGGGEWVGLEVLVNAAVKPAHRAVHGVAHSLFVGRGSRNHVVELHDDVGADGVLEVDGVLGCEEHGGSVMRREEFDTALGHRGEMEKGDHLESRGIRVAVGKRSG